MPIDSPSSIANFRLYQLFSSSLPIGAFTYSQGMEWAVESGWISDQQTMIDWLVMNLNYSVSSLELPIIARIYRGIETEDIEAIHYWSDYLYSCRETKELRAEEVQRGKALYTLLNQLDFASAPLLSRVINDEKHKANSLFGFCLAAHEWQIPLADLQQGYVWGWAENLVMAGVKLVPLGQTAGQRSLIELTAHFPAALANSDDTQDDDVGSFTPSIALASSRHETQYTRLFRS